MPSSCILTIVFPLEITRHILALAIGRDNYWDTSSIRLKICKSSSTLYRIVNSDASFWTYIFISKITEQAELDFYLSKVHNLTLRVHISFRCDYPNHTGDVSRITASLATLMPYIHQFRSFHLETDTPQIIRIVNSAFYFISAPQLHNLRIVRSNRRLSWSPNFGPGEFSPVVWFDAGLPSLTRFTIAGMCAPAVMPISPQLTEFVISDVTFNGTTAVQAFRNFISSCTNLKALALAGICCIGVDTLPNSIVLSPSLEMLYIRFDGQRSLGALFSDFHFTKLRDLIVVVESPEDVDDLLMGQSSTYASVINLRIIVAQLKWVLGDEHEDAGDQVVHWSSFFRLFPSVCTLDLHRADSSTFYSLLSSTSSSVAGTCSNIFPSLSTLYIPYENFYNIRELARLYGACDEDDGLHLKLQTIQVIQSSPRLMISSDEYDAIQWMKTHLAQFRVGTSVTGPNYFGYAITGRGRRLELSAVDTM
ncbi:hypothetical protein B0H19DRAFT_1060128 [Mycena capillaripes]|nr:hypothetical protein B0H19DRAFT_1060128 [Mycena capillaripes]